MSVIILKTIPKFFKEVKAKNKKFEIRKNDRDFCCFDDIVLQEYIPEEDKYTGDCYLFLNICNPITAKDCDGLKDDYVVFSQCISNFLILKYDQKKHQVRKSVRYNPEYPSASRGRLMKIKYILTYEDFPEGLKEGYCILSF